MICEPQQEAICNRRSLATSCRQGFWSYFTPPTEKSDAKGHTGKKAKAGAVRLQRHQSHAARSKRYAVCTTSSQVPLWEECLCRHQDASIFRGASAAVSRPCARHLLKTSAGDVNWAAPV